MREPGITPTGVERTFGDDEVIVSKTDTRGFITYANDVFLRVAAYREEEVLGRPHSIIRHPDMPRTVFKLLWDTISAGEEIFAYVDNLAGDGAHYWVLAHVTPSFDERGRIAGYHSNRRCPSRAAVRAVSPLYRQLLAAERHQPNPVAAMAAGRALLDAELARHNMSYEEYVWSVITGEDAA